MVMQWARNKMPVTINIAASLSFDIIFIGGREEWCESSARQVVTLIKETVSQS